MTEQLIHESKRSKLFYLKDSEFGKPALKKVLNFEFPTPLEISNFYNEYDILEGVKLTGIRSVLKRTKDNNRHAFLMEWVDAPHLKEAFKNKQNDMEDFLYIAISIARVLEGLHNINIVHKDINPFNILVNLQQRSIKLIDFGIASRIDTKQYYTSNPEFIEGTLAYNSPEQTGRMNRIVDYRTDLYSAGITMYEMLCGRLPFVTADPLELVHCHIAAIPKPVCEINPKVPEILSAIIQKLLAKNAEERYQSARGLRKDLEQCLSGFKENSHIYPFALAAKDFSGKFNIPQKLYGRARECSLILSAFESCASGKQAMVFVAGSSGTGKTALVSEICKPITARRGYFVEGKFDQFQRSVPYFAIATFLDDAMNCIRSISVKFSHHHFKSPFDIEMNTGATSLFWSAVSFLKFGKMRKEKWGVEYVEYNRKYPDGLQAAELAVRRHASSFHNLHYYCKTPFLFIGTDGILRYAKYRILPFEKQEETGIDTNPSATDTSNQRILPHETRGRNYLKDEYTRRVKMLGAKYMMQIQTRMASDDDDDEIFNNMIVWDDKIYPWHDLLVIDIDTPLDWKESTLTSFSVNSMPKTLGIIPAKSIYDYNSLNYLRSKSEIARKARLFSYKVFGMVPPIPDDDDRNTGTWSKPQY